MKAHGPKEARRHDLRLHFGADFDSPVVSGLVDGIVPAAEPGDIVCGDSVDGVEFRRALLTARSPEQIARGDIRRLDPELRRLLRGERRRCGAADGRKTARAADTDRRQQRAERNMRPVGELDALNHRDVGTVIFVTVPASTRLPVRLMVWKFIVLPAISASRYDVSASKPTAVMSVFLMSPSRSLAAPPVVKYAIPFCGLM